MDPKNSVVIQQKLSVLDMRINQQELT